jgi:hypothetical protein
MYLQNSVNFVTFDMNECAGREGVEVELVQATSACTRLVGAISVIDMLAAYVRSYPDAGLKCGSRTYTWNQRMYFNIV